MAAPGPFQFPPFPVRSHPTAMYLWQNPQPVLFSFAQRPQQSPTSRSTFCRLKPLQVKPEVPSVANKTPRSAARAPSPSSLQSPASCAPAILVLFPFGSLPGVILLPGMLPSQVCAWSTPPTSVLCSNVILLETLSQTTFYKSKLSSQLSLSPALLFFIAYMT